MEYLEKCGEVFRELAVHARLDTSAVRSLGTVGQYHLTGPAALRRIAPGPRLVERSL